MTKEKATGKSNMTAEEDRGRDDIDIRAVLLVGAALLVTLAIVATAAYLIWRNWAGPSAHDAPRC